MLGLNVLAVSKTHPSCEIQAFTLSMRWYCNTRRGDYPILIIIERRSGMKKMLAVTLLLSVCVVSMGCDGLRFSPSEMQKQNAWLHNRTVAVAAQTAKVEDTSGKLQALTELSELQSKAFTSYYGLPMEVPSAGSAEEILAESNIQLAQTALNQSADRPDVFSLADSVFELAIGIGVLLGGVYGTRAVRFLKDARTKAQALREIIEGNELFKNVNKDYVDAFKQAHDSQSSETRQIVAGMKG